MKYKTDNDLILDFIKGDTNAFNEIYDRYKLLVKSIARKYYLLGGDEEDVFQEGVIGLLNAVSRYNENLENASSFKTFATICIEKNIQTAINKSQNNKNKINDLCVSLDDEKFNVLSNYDEQEFFDNLEQNELQKLIDSKLSSFEKQVLTAYLNGYSYLEIAKFLSKDQKSVDNAMQRIRNKIKSKN